jgi:hypothetical protein
MSPPGRRMRREIFDARAGGGADDGAATTLEQLHSWVECGLNVSLRCRWVSVSAAVRNTSTGRKFCA